MAYPTDDFWNIQRTRRLSVLGEVFSDRLRRNIRVKLGAAYAPAAFNMPSRAYPGYGLFQTIITVNPDDAEKVIQEVKSIAAGLSEKTISPDELHRTLDPMLTGIKDLVRTNDYWLNSVMAGSSRYPQQIDWCRSFQKDYAAISAEDIHQLAIQYLNNRKLSVIQILPEKPSQDSKTAPSPAK
jgi:zinc protease